MMSLVSMYEYYQSGQLMSRFQSLEIVMKHYDDQVSKYPDEKHVVIRVETIVIAMFDEGVHKCV